MCQCELTRWFFGALPRRSLDTRGQSGPIMRDGAVLVSLSRSGPSGSATPHRSARRAGLEIAFAAADDQRGPQGSVGCAVCEDISDSVKRECGRQGRESVYPGGHVRQAYGGGSGNGSATGLFVTVSDFWNGILRGSVPKKRTSITRAIKCLKSIRWMPWR